MTQVFFYHGASQKLGAACQLLGKAAAQKKSVLVYAPETEVAGALDRLLWTYEQLSFAPHCRADSPLAPETPILIADRLDVLPQDQRLMNLGRDVPPDFTRFHSLIEVVGQDPEDRLAARDRVRHYKEQGCDVRYFDLTGKAA